VRVTKNASFVVNITHLLNKIHVDNYNKKLWYWLGDNNFIEEKLFVKFKMAAILNFLQWAITQEQFVINWWKLLHYMRIVNIQLVLKYIF